MTTALPSRPSHGAWHRCRDIAGSLIGIVLAYSGVFLTLTVVGAIIGLPMLGIGLSLLGDRNNC